MRINWAYKSHSYLSFINCSLSWCGIDVLIFARLVFFVGCLIFFSGGCHHHTVLTTPVEKVYRLGLSTHKGSQCYWDLHFFCLLLFLQEKTIFSFQGVVKVQLHCRPQRYSLGREMLHGQLKMQFCFVLFFKRLLCYLICLVFLIPWF